MAIDEEQYLFLKDMSARFEIAGDSSNLSEWEYGFMESIADRLEAMGDNMNLSEKQMNILIRIDAKL